MSPWAWGCIFGGLIGFFVFLVQRRKRKKSKPGVVSCYMADWNWGIGMWVCNGTDQDVVISRAYILCFAKENSWRYYDTFALVPKPKSKKVAAGKTFPVYFMADVAAIVSYEVEKFTTVVELVDGRKIVAKGRRVIKSKDQQFFKIKAEEIEV